MQQTGVSIGQDGRVSFKRESPNGSQIPNTKSQSADWGQPTYLITRALLSWQTERCFAVNCCYCPDVKAVQFLLVGFAWGNHWRSRRDFTKSLLLPAPSSGSVKGSLHLSHPLLLTPPPHPFLFSENLLGLLARTSVAGSGTRVTRNRTGCFFFLSLKKKKDKYVNISSLFWFLKEKKSGTNTS